MTDSLDLQSAMHAHTGDLASVIEPDAYEAVRRLAGIMTRSPEDAEDAVQDVLVHALRDRGKLRDERSARPWLRRVTLNSCHSLYRRRRARSAQSLDAIAQDRGQSVSDLVAAAEPADALCTADLALAREWLALAIAGLKADRRVVFELRFVDGLSAREIGRRLRMPLSTVKDNLAQARRRLAGRLRPLACSLGVVDASGPAAAPLR